MLNRISFWAMTPDMNEGRNEGWRGGGFLLSGCCSHCDWISAGGPSRYQSPSLCVNQTWTWQTAKRWGLFQGRCWIGLCRLSWCRPAQSITSSPPQSNMSRFSPSQEPNGGLWQCVLAVTNVHYKNQPGVHYELQPTERFSSPSTTTNCSLGSRGPASPISRKSLMLAVLMWNSGK